MTLLIRGRAVEDTRRGIVAGIKIDETQIANLKRISGRLPRHGAVGRGRWIRRP